MEYKTPAQYAAEHPEIKWDTERSPFYLYRTSNVRFKVSVESGKHPKGYAWDLGLSDQYMEAGIDEFDRDAEALAEDFVNLFCNHLSLRDLQVLIPRLQKFYDEWEARRQRSIALMNHTNSSGPK